jgi:hypothetical protein
MRDSGKYGTKRMSDRMPGFAGYALKTHRHLIEPLQGLPICPVVSGWRSKDTLAIWVTPKESCTNPKERGVAVGAEDHPLERVVISDIAEGNTGKLDVLPDGKAK